MPGEDELNSSMDAENSILVLKAEAVGDETRLDSAEHDRLPDLLNQRHHEQGKRMATCPIRERLSPDNLTHPALAGAIRQRIFL